MRRLVHVRALLLVVVLACSGCLWQHDTVQLQFAGGVPNHVGQGAARIHPGMPVSIGDMSLCLTRAGRVTIDRVNLVEPVGGGVQVDGWTLVNHPEQATSRFASTDRRSLSSYGFPLTHTVDVPCQTGSGHLDELVVQVERRDPENAGFHAFRIDWSSDDDHGSLVFPLSIALCNGDAGAPRCEALGVLG